MPSARLYRLHVVAVCFLKVNFRLACKSYDDDIINQNYKLNQTIELGVPMRQFATNKAQKDVSNSP